MKTINVLTVSGGKDSTAMWLLALERGVEVAPVFCDTGHESSVTYEYLDYLESNLGPIKRIKADFTQKIAHKREVVQTKWKQEGVSEEIIQSALDTLKPTGIPFLDLCIYKGCFPSTKRKFCTIELKVHPMFDQIYLPLLESGHHVISWQGIRAQESLSRSKLPEREETPEGYEIFRPILKWTASEVFDQHRKHGIEPNPLYKSGMGRVGCMPCVNSGKDELFEIQRRFPEEIKRVAEWERIVSMASKRGASSFFIHDDVMGEGIHEVVEWSKTARGGKQYDLFKWAAAEEEIITCSSQYGLCE